MISQRQLFYNLLGQTSSEPPALEIEKAEGVWLYDTSGKKYLDLISGISVSNVGHKHPAVVEAVINQAEKHMHLMVYGEYIQNPQVSFAEKLVENLPDKLNSVYYVNSGSEAIEGALKLAKKYTGRSEIIACRNAYHGSTHGALSLMSNEYFSGAFRPLVPGIKFMDFNNLQDIEKITKKTAAVVIEVIQAEAGIIEGEKDFIKSVRQKCDETGALLIIDEVQTGFGRTGKLFGFEHYDIVPDIITTAKGMGAGMPIGAFISDKKIMHALSDNPILGHITTFGGHPVSAAAGLAGLNVLLDENLIEKVTDKEQIILNELNHKEIKSISGRGLFFSVGLENTEKLKKFIKIALKKGIITDWFLFNDTKFRIAPPLTIADEELKYAVTILKSALNEL